MDVYRGRSLTVSEISSLLTEARERTLLLTAALSDEDLRLQHDPLMSPIVWDLGHIGHFEDIWLRENLRSADTGSEGLRGIYNPFDNPRAARGSLALPSLTESRRYLGDVRRAVLEELDRVDLSGGTRLLEGSFVYRMVLQHEYQHNETILQTLQLKRGGKWTPPRQLTSPRVAPDAPPAGEMVRFPGGPVVLGTDDRSAAYDNERPAHRVDMPPFWIDVHPVTNGEYAAFIRDGGYTHPDHWSNEGWAWREAAGLIGPKNWSESDGKVHERFMDQALALDRDSRWCGGAHP